jgi:hypothetical protein
MARLGLDFKQQFPDIFIVPSHRDSPPRMVGTSSELNP